MIGSTAPNILDNSNLTTREGIRQLKIKITSLPSRLLLLFIRNHIIPHCLQRSLHAFIHFFCFLQRQIMINQPSKSP
jgi:hypothetical protein